MAAEGVLMTETNSRGATSDVRLGGYSALAQSAWMGSVQGTEVLEPLNLSRKLQRLGVRLPRVSVSGLLTRQFSVAEASVILMGSFFLSAMLGAVRQILFNASFGVGMEANAYYAAFRLPDTLFSLIAGGALSSAMIPVLLRAEQDEGRAAVQRTLNLVLTALLAFFAVVVLALEVFTPFFVQTILAPGFDQPTSQLTITLTRVMLLQPLILSLASVATAVLNGRNQFLLTGLALLSHNITLILGILVATARSEVGIYGPTVAVLCGALFQVVILLPGLMGNGARLRLLWQPNNVHLREVTRLLIPNGLSVSVNYAGSIVDTAFASTVANMAALSAIYNGWLLAGLPVALLGQAIGQAAFPRLAAQAEQGDFRTLRRTLIRTLGVAVLLAIPAVAALALLGRTAIRILFERGEFGVEAGNLTYAVLLGYAVALPAFVATEVVTRGLTALRDTRTPLATNLGQLAGRVLLMSIFISRIGVLAVPLALAVTATLETFTLGFVLFVRVRKGLKLRS